MNSNSLLAFFLFAFATSSEDTYCSLKDSACSHNLAKGYSENESYKQILNKISDAEKNFVPCAHKNCSCFFSVLSDDLKPFKVGIDIKELERVRNKGTTYVISKNKLYRSEECMFPARCSGVEHFLKELLPKLPDSEFILNSRDWPQISRQFGVQGPVFSFSKTPDYTDIQFPAWSFWEGGPAIKSYPTGLGRWDLMLKKFAQAEKMWPWENKLDKGFFRGSRTSSERDILILLSRSHPTLLDAQYTKNQAWKSPADTLNAEPANEVPLEDHCKYKYLFNMRGVAASFRFKHLFLCGSLVIHVGDEWTEFFYGALKPWVHYVPISKDATQEEYLNLMNFLVEHDDIAKTIAQRGLSFIKSNLQMKDVKCYWRNLLKRYSKLLKFPVKVHSNLKEVK